MAAVETDFDMMLVLSLALTSVVSVSAVSFEVMRARRFRAYWWDRPKTSVQPQAIDDPAVLLAHVVSRLKCGLSTSDAWAGALAGTQAQVRVGAWRNSAQSGAQRNRTRAKGGFAMSVAASVDDLGVPELVRNHAAFAPYRSSIVAACQLSHDLGTPLAQTLEVVLEGIEDAKVADRARRVAQAGPRLSARLLLWLPALGLAAAWLLGADLPGILFDGAAGSLALALGIVLWIAGHRWTRKMVLAAAQTNSEGVDPVIEINLLASALRVGSSIPHALETVARACADPPLSHMGTLLRLGSPRTQMPTPHEYHAKICDALWPAWSAGASPMQLLTLAAQAIRKNRLTQTQEQAQQLGVKLVLPLGLCLLPAFVCIGVVPIVIMLFTAV
ncbi:type II secretion system F family protein [Gleimia hominis]|uniref:type II secretion system F family protein n=1 Tax=Gleimia hominis TaxID=595468 RepID=UPI000C80FC01|nr:type II secretion system F family protein [Gleimia hominis]WIK64031.1 type II secretion system F family protein [Gleimia hominis]